MRKSSKSTPRTQIANGTNGSYLNPRSVNTSTSEPDNIVNLYSDPSTNKSDLHRRGSDYTTKNTHRPAMDDPDYEKWIHRDKLATIEREELQAAGFVPAEESYRSSKSRRTQSRDRLTQMSSTEEQQEEWTPTQDEMQATSPASAPKYEEPEGMDHDGWDLRTPEEIAAESTPTGRGYSYPIVRRSGSKIPVLTSSPLPVPSERQERETPLPRKRTFSGSIRDDDLSGSPTKPRTRGSSVGSAYLLDDLEPRPGSRSADGTSMTGKSTGKMGVYQATSPGSGSRKVTPAGSKKPVSGHKARVPSNSSSPQTLSRSGDPERPRTAVNRPEGEAPWIATMYKPDPRLPPDQQILPTHAKKQQQLLQQQQELETHKVKQGDQQPIQTSSLQNPSRDSRTSPPTSTRLDPHSQNHNQQLQLRTSPSLSPPVPATEVDEDPSTWAYRPRPGLHSQSFSKDAANRPGTSGSSTGGYSTMPRVVGSFSSQGGQGPVSPILGAGSNGGRNESFSITGAGSNDNGGKGGRDGGGPGPGPGPGMAGTSPVKNPGGQGQAQGYAGISEPGTGVGVGTFTTTATGPAASKDKAKDDDGVSKGCGCCIVM